MAELIYNPWWCSLGSFFCIACVIICSYNLTRKLEDEVIEEEPTTRNRYEARITRAVK